MIHYWTRTKNPIDTGPFWKRRVNALLLYSISRFITMCFLQQRVLPFADAPTPVLLWRSWRFVGLATLVTWISLELKIVVSLLGGTISRCCGLGLEDSHVAAVALLRPLSIALQWLMTWAHLSCTTRPASAQEFADTVRAFFVLSQTTARRKLFAVAFAHCGGTAIMFLFWPLMRASRSTRSKVVNSLLTNMIMTVMSAVEAFMLHLPLTSSGALLDDVKGAPAFSKIFDVYFIIKCFAEALQQRDGFTPDEATSGGSLSEHTSVILKKVLGQMWGPIIGLSIVHSFVW